MTSGKDGLTLETVWIVQHDESPHETVLGVFRTQDDARDYAEEIKHHFPDGVIYTSFPIGYRRPMATPYTGAPPPAPEPPVPSCRWRCDASFACAR